MPTIEALETALVDYKRAQLAFADLLSRRDTLQAQINAIEGQLSSAKASLAANEDTLRNVVLQFGKANR